jgi:hypothetical protein
LRLLLLFNLPKFDHQPTINTDPRNAEHSSLKETREGKKETQRTRADDDIAPSSTFELERPVSCRTEASGIYKEKNDEKVGVGGEAKSQTKARRAWQQY